MSKVRNWYKRIHQYLAYTLSRGEHIEDELDNIQASFEKIPDVKDDGSGFKETFSILAPEQDDHPVQYRQVKHLTEQLDKIDQNTIESTKQAETAKQYGQAAKDMAINLGKPDGYRLLGRCKSIEELRNTRPSYHGQRIIVDSYYEGGTTGGGEFVADLQDSVTVDDGGICIINDSSNGRWKRCFTKISPYDFGVKANGIIDDESAFFRLESTIRNNIIDLDGKTYKVSTGKSGNYYTNGKFLFDGLNGSIPYETSYNLIKSGNGIIRIGGGNKFPEGYAKTQDPFNVHESVVAIGAGALDNATSAGQTIAIGGNALHKATKSYSNIAIGETALESLQSSGSTYPSGGQGSRNIAIGGNALQFLEDGVRNVAIGRNTGCGVSKAWDCTLIGAGAMSGQNANGWHAEVESQLGNKNEGAKVTAIGMNSIMYFTGLFASTLGVQSGFNLKIGSGNTLVGNKSGFSLEKKVGWDGLTKTTYGDGTKGKTVNYTKTGNKITITLEHHQCVVGGTAQIKWNDGSAFPQPAHWHAWRQEVIDVTDSTVSFYCPYEGDGEGTATIYWSLSTQKDTKTSVHNTIIGHQAAMEITEASNSVVVGSIALQKDIKLNNSVIVGRSAAALAEGDLTDAVIIGKDALANAKSNMLGAVVIGTRAANNAIKEADNITIVGYQACQVMHDGSPITIDLGNCTLIGANSRVSGKNQVQLGSSSTTVYTFGAVQNRSDARDKTDIRDTQLGLDFINKIRPVDFKWDYRDDYSETVEEQIGVDDDGNPIFENKIIRHKRDGSKKRARYHHGVVAQEIKSVADELGIEFGGYQDHSINDGSDVLSIGYEEFIGPLIKAIQELSNKNKILEFRVNELEQKL